MRWILVTVVENILMFGISYVIWQCNLDTGILRNIALQEPLNCLIQKVCVS